MNPKSNLNRVHSYRPNESDAFNTGRVYRAILDGADAVTQTAGLLPVGLLGAKWTITTYVSGDNFLNIGAPSNTTGVTFTVTGITPTTWTHGSQLDYNGALFPIAIFENTLGLVTWTRVSAGIYRGANAQLLLGKTFILTNGQAPAVDVYQDTTGYIEIVNQFATVEEDGGTESGYGLSYGYRDNIADPIHLEIRVYP